MVVCIQIERLVSDRGKCFSKINLKKQSSLHFFFLNERPRNEYLHGKLQGKTEECSSGQSEEWLLLREGRACDMKGTLRFLAV